MHLGDRIVALRGLRSQREIAAKAGIHSASLSRIEKGKNANPSRLTLERIAKALGVEVERLYETPKAPGVQTGRPLLVDPMALDLGALERQVSPTLYEALVTMQEMMRNLYSIARDARDTAYRAERRASRRGRRSAGRNQSVA